MAGVGGMAKVAIKYPLKAVASASSSETPPISNILIFTFVLFVLHVIEVFTGFTWSVSIPVYIVIGVLVWLLRIYKFFDLRTLIAVLLITFFLPYLVYLVKNPAFYIAIVYFPLHILYVIFSVEHPFFNLLKTIFVIWALILVLPPTISILMEHPEFDKYNLQDSIQATTDLMWAKTTTGLGSAWKGTIDIFREGYIGFKRTTNESLNYGLGQEYYRAEVEQNSKEKIGVYVEKLSQTDPVFYENQPIYLLAKLYAKNYQSENENTPLKVTTSCVSDRTSENKIEGITKPISLSVFNTDEQNVDCIFGQNGVEVLTYGAHTITFFADFNFVTKADTIVNFAKPELRKAQSEGVDLYTQYHLLKNPKTIYTQGPIEIGSDMQKILFLDESRQPSFTFTIKNKWEGDIKEIGVTLTIPKGLAIPGGGCNKEFKSISQTEDRVTYQLVDPIQYVGSINNFAQSFRCSFDVVNPEDLLKGSDASKRVFSVETNYKYSLRKSKSIEVKRDQ